MFARPISLLERLWRPDLGARLIFASLLNKRLLHPDLPDSQALKNFCHATEPTRITDSTETIREVILGSNAKQIVETEVLSPSISDHDLVYVTLKMKKQRLHATFVTCRSFKTDSSERFDDDITCAPCRSVLETFDDPDNKLHVFNLLFNEILDEHAPLKAIRLRRRPNLYITDEIRDLMATRDGWKRKFKQTKDTLAWSSCKTYCREVKRKIRLAERNLWHNKLKMTETTLILGGKGLAVVFPKKRKYCDQRIQ